MLIRLARAEARGRVPVPRADARGLAPPYPHFSPAVQSLLTLSSGGCRWPLGVPGEDLSSFCGRPSIPRSSYCAAHKALACEAVR